MNSSICVADAWFGPAVEGCRDDFDFTIKFEKISFSLIPTAVFIAACPLRIIYLVRRRSFVDGTWLRTSKQVVILAYTAIQLSLLVLSAVRPDNLESFLVSSSTLTLVSGLCLSAVSHLEHSRSPRPSHLLTAYLTLTTLLDVAQARTVWLVSPHTNAEVTFARLFTAAVAAKAVLVVLEASHKSRWIRWDNGDSKEAVDHSPEETSSLFDLGAFAWLNHLFLTGYSKVMALSDLYPLDRSMTSETLHTQLADKLGLPSRKHGLAKDLARTFAVPLLLPVAPRIAMGAFQFCQPFLIESLLGYLQQPVNGGQHYSNVGYGLIGATILIYSGIAFSQAFYWYYQERVLYMMRGALTTVIYQKTTESKASAGEDKAALTLMSTDIDRVIMGFTSVHEFWANIIQVGLACWLLSRQIGAAFVAPLVVVGCCVVCSALLGKLIGPRQKAWMGEIQHRVGVTAGVIGQMKHLKISGLTAPVEDMVQRLRVSEISTGAEYRLVTVYSAVMGYIPLCFSPVVAFAWSAQNQTLDVSTIFTTISYILLLAGPLGSLFQMYPTLLAGFACLGRIQAFLEQDPRSDFRTSSLTGSNEKSADDSSENVLRGDNNSPAIGISGASFGWEAEKPNLRDIDLTIRTSRLTMVVGPVASGKSTLCKALLGETPLAVGRVAIDASIGKIGYCDQTPFLLNSTIRENIVGFAPFDSIRYHEVVECSMLQADLTTFPQGDGTNVGSNGITLSGGQKQRVAIARALYLDTNMVIFDDVLSGLDADTEEEVFRRVLSPNGVLRRRKATVVLCTHSVKHLPFADHVVALDPDGRIVEQGTFSKLMANMQYVYSLGVKEQSTDAPSEAEPAQPEPKPAAQPAPISAKPAQPDEKHNQARMMGDTTVYRHYLARINPLSIGLFFVFGLGWGFFANFTTIWLKFWSDDATSANPRPNGFYIGIYALFQAMTLLSLLCLCLTTFLGMIKISGAKLHHEALATVINAPLRFFASTDVGVVTNLFSQDMTLIDTQLPMSMVNLALYTFQCIAMAAVIATGSPYLAISYPFLLAILYAIQKFYLRTSRQMRLLDLEAKSPLYTHFLDTIKGLPTFRAFGWLAHGAALNSQLVDTSQRPAYLLALIQRWLGLVLQFVVAALAVVVVALATQIRSDSSTALTGASLVTLMSFGESLAWIVKMYTMLETSIGAVARLNAFSERVKPEGGDGGEEAVLEGGWPRRGEIQLVGVSASNRWVLFLLRSSLGCADSPSEIDSSADPSSDEISQQLVLRDVDLTIKPGEKVAICGRSGSGKSSLVLLLLRLLDPLPPATITIDTVPLSKINRAALRAALIAIPQDPVFLPSGASFLANLDPLDASTAAECRGVLETVNLWAFVAEHGGLGADMAADALSQGQKQLFSLARAVVRRRVRAREAEAEMGEKGAVGQGGVLLLDEVSSSVDQETEREMQRVIAGEFEGYTIVMVSHRLDVVMGFDTVVVMDKGRLVETGVPRELVRREGGRFRELWMVGSGDVGGDEDI
ncbi:ATPase-like protein [Lasiosphaeris hirsuta]|uniref:ATPase-like protein n=1 Tax=Lasiosphaeris hirsuta TaxID=260670 RepID=A0AA40A9A0_9PEZI|nr:ATPase-like protein [Lasiosphaeris hirsuta]